MIVDAKNLPKAIFVDGSLGTNPNHTAKKLSYHLASELEVVEVKDLGIHKRRPAIIMHVDPFERWKQDDINRLRRGLVEEDESVLIMAWGAVHSAARQIDTIRHRNPDEHPDIVVASNWLGFFYSVTRNATKAKITEPVKEAFNEFLCHPFLDFSRNKVVAVNTFLVQESFDYHERVEKEKNDQYVTAGYGTARGYQERFYLDRCKHRENVDVRSVDLSYFPKHTMEAHAFEFACKSVKKAIGW